MPSRYRTVLAAVILLMGTLQAWDSDVFRSTPLVMGTVLAGIVLLATAMLLVPRPNRAITALLAGAILLIAGRILSPIPHNELGVILPIAAVPTMLMIAQEIRRVQESR